MHSPATTWAKSRRSCCPEHPLLQRANALCCNGELSVVTCRLRVMTMLEVIPQEFFDGVAVPVAVSLDGELLGALDEVPAGPWLGQLLDSVDVSSLTTFELPS